MPQLTSDWNMGEPNVSDSEREPIKIQVRTNAAELNNQRLKPVTIASEQHEIRYQSLSPEYYGTSDHAVGIQVAPTGALSFLFSNLPGIFGLDEFSNTTEVRMAWQGPGK